MITKQEIKDLLHQDTYQIKFRKKDGTERIMICTLQENMLPKQELDQEVKQVKKQADTNLPVWDLEKKSWRSFCIDSVLEYKRLDPNTSCIISE